MTAASSAAHTDRGPERLAKRATPGHPLGEHLDPRARDAALAAAGEVLTSPHAGSTYYRDFTQQVFVDDHGWRADQMVHTVGISVHVREHLDALTRLGESSGLRPNEVRALLRRDMKLRREGDAPVGGFLSIREGLSYGETHTPKTGVREVPISRALAALLANVEKGPREGHVALTTEGEPWGQYGLDQAFERVRDRAGLAGWSVYSLRHYAITTWLRRGIPVHVVQKMAGHRNLETTQHYVHYLKTDLEDAARLLDDDRGNGRGNSGVTAPQGNGGPSDKAA